MAVNIARTMKMTPQTNDTQKPQRAQLKHLLLDINFKDKPKILDLEELYTPIARLLVIDILSACSCATDAMISTGVCVALGRRIGLVPERTREIVKYCTDNNILIIIDGKITNQRVINDQESFHHKRVTNKERQQKYRERESVNNALPTRLPVIDSDNDTDSVLDLKKNSQSLKLPREYDTPEIQSALSACIERLRKSGRDLDQITLEAKIVNFKTPKAFLDALLYTAGLTKSKNIYPPPESWERTRDGPGLGNRNFNKALELAKKYEELGE